MIVRGGRRAAFVPLVIPPGLKTAVFMMWVAVRSLMLLINNFRSDRPAGPGRERCSPGGS